MPRASCSVVQSARCVVQLDCEILAGHLADGQGEQNLALDAQLVAIKRPRELAGSASSSGPAREGGRTASDRYRSALAGVAEPPADLAGHLERCEPPPPHHEQRIVSKLVELGEDRDEGVIGGLDGEVVEVASGKCARARRCDGGSRSSPFLPVARAADRSPPHAVGPWVRSSASHARDVGSSARAVAGSRS